MYKSKRYAQYIALRTSGKMYEACTKYGMCSKAYENPVYPASVSGEHAQH